MEIVILIERLASGEFRARAGEPLNLCSEGTSAEEAAQKLAEQFESLLASGCQITTMTVANGKAVIPPLPADNAYETDWVFGEMQEAIADNRRQEEKAART